MRSYLLGLMILAACDQGIGSKLGIRGTSDSDEVVVQLSGAPDKLPPALRIPRSYLPNDLLADASSGTVSAVSVPLLIPDSAAFRSSASHEFISGYRPVRITNVKEGTALRWRRMIDLAVARNGSRIDEQTGLQRVLLEYLPGHQERYRYFNDSKQDVEYVHLDCIFYEHRDRDDTCFMQIVVVKGIAISTHFRADGLSQWKLRESDMRQLAKGWLQPKGDGGN
jgi:hypothetical protein